MDHIDDLIAAFDSKIDKIDAMDEVQVECSDDRRAVFFLAVATSSRYDIDTRHHAVRLLRYVFPNNFEVKQKVLFAALQFAGDKSVDETLRQYFLEVVLFSDRTYDAVRAIVALMADPTDSLELRETACDVLRRHLDKEEVRRAIEEIKNRDGIFNDCCSRLI